MKRIFTIAIAACLCATLASAQTNEEYEKGIRQFHECFYNKLSKPAVHEEEITLSTGKTVTSLAQSDYERSAFVSADNLLREVTDWKKSPFTWQMQHRKNNKAVMDKQDLSSWERNSFDKISQQYFEGSNSTFHIAAHGLLGAEPDDDGILIGGQKLNAAETAELITLSMQNDFHDIINVEKQDFVVVLHSCNSASGENNFARQLSIELSKRLDNVSVVGAPDVVWCSMSADGGYDEYVSSEEDARWYNPEKKNWRVYKNGADTGQGQQGYKETIKTIQK